MKYIIWSVLLFCVNQVAGQRIALLETFTNASCTPCATWEPAFNQMMDTFSQNTIRIAYHVAVPGLDSMHLENPTQVIDRQNLYGVTGTPWTQINGTAAFGTAILVNFWSDAIEDTFDTDVLPKYDVEIVNPMYKNKFHKGKIRFTSRNNFSTNDTLQAMIVLVEKDVLKSSYLAAPGTNSETHYEYVMRKMLTGSMGVQILNTSLNAETLLDFSATIPYIKDTTGMQIVAFVQNKTTHEVYQAAMLEPVYTAHEVIENTMYMQDTIHAPTAYISTYTYDTIYTSSTMSNDTNLVSFTAHMGSNNSLDTMVTSVDTLDIITTATTITISDVTTIQDTFLMNYQVTVYVDTTVSSVLENDDFGFQVYPNPFTDGVVITSRNLTQQSMRIEWIDLAGRSVYVVEDYLSGSMLNPSLEAGVYFIKINDNIAFKVLKENR